MGNRGILCGELSQAKWREELMLAEVTHKVGDHWQYLGHNVGEQLFLNPEETLFLMEENCLYLKHGEATVSLQQAYSLLLRSETPRLQYKVYAALSRVGCKVFRHEKEEFEIVVDTGKETEKNEENTTMDIRNNNYETNSHNEEIISTQKPLESENSIENDDDSIVEITNENQTEDEYMDISLLMLRPDLFTFNISENYDYNNPGSADITNQQVEINTNCDGEPKETTENIGGRESLETNSHNEEIISTQKPLENENSIENDDDSKIEFTNENQTEDEYMDISLLLKPDLLTFNISENNGCNNPGSADITNQQEEINTNCDEEPKETDENIPILEEINTNCDGEPKETDENIPIFSYIRESLENYEYNNPGSADITNQQAEIYTNCDGEPKETAENIGVRESLETNSLNEEIIGTQKPSENENSMKRKITNENQTEDQNMGIGLLPRPNLFLRSPPQFSEQTLNYMNFNSNVSTRYCNGNPRKREHLESIKRLAYRLTELVQYTNVDSENVKTVQKIINTYNVLYKTRIYLTDQNTIEEDDTVLRSMDLDSQDDIPVETIDLYSEDSNEVEIVELDAEDERPTKKPRVEFVKNNYEETLNRIKILALNLKYRQERDKALSRDFSNTIEMFNKTYNTDIYLNSHHELASRFLVNLGTSSKSDCVLKEISKPKAASGKMLINPFSYQKRLSENHSNIPQPSTSKKGMADEEIGTVEVLKKPSIIQTNTEVATEINFSVDFDVYNKDGKNFSKTNRPKPHFRVICIHESSSLPSGSVIYALQSKYDNVVFAVVSIDSISYLQLNPAKLPVYTPRN